MPSRNRIVIGTRKSRLALAQTQMVADAIRRVRPDITVDLHRVVTQGDIKLDRPLPEIGGKGLFTMELEQALLSGQVDLAVHSAKDLPTGPVDVAMPSGRGLPTDPANRLDILCVPPRAPVNDVLVSPSGHGLSDLPPGSRIGTSSLRRQLQLKAVRSDLQFLDIRGNIDTRINKAMTGQYDAVVLAEAGLIRAGMTDVPYAPLPVDQILPAPGQAAFAIQGRTDDDWLRDVLSDINDPTSAECLAAERALVEQLGLDCQMPFAALCERLDSGYRLRTWLADPASARSIRTDVTAATWTAAVSDAGAKIEAEGGRQIIQAFKKPT